MVFGLMSGRPSASSAATASRMRAVRQSLTKPELDLQDRLRSIGRSYQTDVAPVAGSRRRADIVYHDARVAVLVHGCFWHSCPYHKSVPKTNTEWWVEKLKANRRRDNSTMRLLRGSGWTVVRVWAHEDMDRAARRIRAAVVGRAGDAIRGEST